MHQGAHSRSAPRRAPFARLLQAGGSLARLLQAGGLPGCRCSSRAAARARRTFRSPPGRGNRHDIIIALREGHRLPEDQNTAMRSAHRLQRKTTSSNATHTSPTKHTITQQCETYIVSRQAENTAMRNVHRLRENRKRSNAKRAPFASRPQNTTTKRPKDSNAKRTSFATTMYVSHCNLLVVSSLCFGVCLQTVRVSHCCVCGFLAADVRFALLCSRPAG